MFLDLTFIAKYYRDRGCLCKDVEQVVAGFPHQVNCPLFFGRRVSAIG